MEGRNDKTENRLRVAVVRSKKDFEKGQNNKREIMVKRRKSNGRKYSVNIIV